MVVQCLKIACDFVKLKFEWRVFVAGKNILPNGLQVDVIEQKTAEKPVLGIGN
jgi:hypothetical protein